MTGSGVALQFSLFGTSISIHWYGIIIAVGLLLAILLAMYHTKREGHNPDSILDMALIIIPLAVIFARLYYVVFNWDIYAGKPFWHVFAIWEGGLGIYGGVIGGFLGVLLYAKLINKKIGFVNLLDIAAPSLILGQAIGRWGNFLNQEAYGYAVNNPAWQWFPASVYITSPKILGQQEGWYMATFFYESMWSVLVFAFLFFYFKNYKKRKPGDIFWFYLLLYGIGRAVIEGLRTDSLYIPGTGIRASQWLSVLLVAVSACVLLSPLVKEVFAEMKKRRLADGSVPLDDSLKLTVDIEDEVTEQEPEKPADTIIAAESSADSTDTEKTKEAEEK
jgi:phosphatidylglycerol---prolipoprotein diacylglyceryl transferase